MERLTKERLGITKNGKEFVICNHEESDCNDSCKNLVCEWNEKAQMRLHEYEDIGLSPEEIIDGKLLTGWIPISERLPEEPPQGKLPEYIVTIHGASEATTLIYAGDGYWWDPIEGERYAVSAWMPMPEAYKTNI
jgi:hypothetical protein